MYTSKQTENNNVKRYFLCTNGSSNYSYKRSKEFHCDQLTNTLVHTNRTSIHNRFVEARHYGVFPRIVINTARVREGSSPTRFSMSNASTYISVANSTLADSATDLTLINILTYCAFSPCNTS